MEGRIVPSIRRVNTCPKPSIATVLVSFGSIGRIISLTNLSLSFNELSAFWMLAWFVPILHRLKDVWKEPIKPCRTAWSKKCVCPGSMPMQRLINTYRSLLPNITTDLRCRPLQALTSINVWMKPLIYPSFSPSTICAKSPKPCKSIMQARSIKSWPNIQLIISLIKKFWLLVMLMVVSQPGLMANNSTWNFWNKDPNKPRLPLLNPVNQNRFHPHMTILGGPMAKR